MVGVVGVALFRVDGIIWIGMGYNLYNHTVSSLFILPFVMICSSYFVFIGRL